MLSLVEAAEQAGVERFVFVSYAGAPAGLGSPLERAKVAVERRLSSSPMRATLVRPDAFQEIHLAPLGRFDIEHGKVAVFGKGDSKRRWVSTENVAELIAAVALESDPPSVIEFGGPENISRNGTVALIDQGPRTCGVWLESRGQRHKVSSLSAARTGSWTARLTVSS
jgi:uncharacterized protein YbjT (DUF2867 family)